MSMQKINERMTHRVAIKVTLFDSILMIDKRQKNDGS